MKVLVAYASKHGGTAGIADHIADTLRRAGLEVDICPAGEVAGADAYGAFVIGSAIYAGSWMKDAVELIEDNVPAISGHPVWLFSSGPVEGPVEDAEEQPRQLAGFRELIDVREHVVFGGRLDPDLLGFGERMIMKAVKARRSDSRDWDAIARWAAGVAAQLSGDA